MRLFGRMRAQLGIMMRWVLPGVKLLPILACGFIRAKPLGKAGFVLEGVELCFGEGIVKIAELEHGLSLMTPDA